MFKRLIDAKPSTKGNGNFSKIISTTKKIEELTKEIFLLNFISISIKKYL